MNCVEFMDNNPNIFNKLNNREYKRRDTFHIGTITKQNRDDNSFDLISSNDTQFKSVAAMNAQTADQLKQGAPVLFLHGSETSLTQIYDLSPWVIGTQMQTG